MEGGTSVASLTVMIGAGKESEFLISSLSLLPSFKIIGRVVFDPPGPKNQFTNHSDIPLVDLKKLSNKKIDLAFICSDIILPESVQTYIKKIVPFEETKLLCSIVHPLYQLLLDTESQREKYQSAINATSEGIQIIDENGVIEHVNPAFMKILGVHPSDRIGKSIFEISGGGAGVKVLETGLPAKGVCNQVAGSSATVVSNGAPLIINGQRRGAIVLFQEVTDILRISRELQESRLKIETLNQELGYVKSSSYSFMDMIGNNKKLLEAINIAQHAAKNDSTVLITGESGTGKEIMAQAIHHASPRWKKPFIAVNCASFPESLIESELFGHEKGAFTGAAQAKIGKFELANDGIIFLDEIGDLALNVQAKLLRVLQEKHFERVGGNERMLCNAKVLAATNKNLTAMVKKGQFRADLFYRLQVIHISIPPLRERREDIPQLAEHLLLKICKKFNKPVPKLDKEAMQLLLDYSWPGNIRELENTLTRAMNVCSTEHLIKNDINPLLSNASVSEFVPDKGIESLEEVEIHMILRALNTYGYTTIGKRAAAKVLNISLGTLYNKIKFYNLEKNAHSKK
jgi:transcriptional regulator with PAS, ATPase and Fis domain